MTIIKTPAPSTDNGGDEFIEALIAFASQYVSEIKISLFAYADEIANNVTIRTLLLEYNRRRKKCDEDYRRLAEIMIKHGTDGYSTDTFKDSVLDHPSSYRDVLDDLLRPYFPNRD